MTIASKGNLAYRNFLIVLIGTSSLGALASCSTTGENQIYNKGVVPTEEMSKVYFSYGLRLNKINDDWVSHYNVNLLIGGYEPFTLSMPPGDYNLSLRFENSSGQTHYNDLLINIESGRCYRVGFNVNKNPLGNMTCRNPPSGIGCGYGSFSHREAAC